MYTWRLKNYFIKTKTGFEIYFYQKNNIVLSKNEQNMNETTILN